MQSGAVISCGLLIRIHPKLKLRACPVVKILVLADLHLDFWLGSGRDPFADLDPALLSSLDAFIVAGDLSNKPKTRWPHMIKHLARYVEPRRIYLLPGNHDYYDHVLGGDDRLARICETEGVNFVQKAEVVTDDVRLLCGTLWTDFALNGDPVSAMRTAETGTSDYHYSHPSLFAYAGQSMHWHLCDWSILSTVPKSPGVRTN